MRDNTCSSCGEQLGKPHRHGCIVALLDERIHQLRAAVERLTESLSAAVRRDSESSRQLAEDDLVIRELRAEIESLKALIKSDYVHKQLTQKLNLERDQAQAACVELRGALRDSTNLLEFDVTPHKTPRGEKVAVQLQRNEALLIGDPGQAFKLDEAEIRGPLLQWLRRVKQTCATVYQWAGANDWPVELLDNLSIIAEGQQAEESPERHYHEELPVAIDMLAEQRDCIEKLERVRDAAILYVHEDAGGVEERVLRGALAACLLAEGKATRERKTP